MDLKEKILESIEYVKPDLENKEEVATEIESVVRTHLIPVAEREGIELEQLLQELLEVAFNKELLETYKGVDPKELWWYCILRVKKKYKPRPVTIEEIDLIPFGVSAERRIKDQPTCIVYALKVEGKQFTPIRIFLRGHLRNKVNDLEFFALYRKVKLELRGVFYEAVNETEFVNPKFLDIDPEKFFLEMLPKYGVTVKKITAFTEFLDPSNLSKTDSRGFPEEFDLRVVTGEVLRKSVNEERNRVIYTIYDGLTDKEVAGDDIVVTGELPVFCHMKFGEYGEENFTDYLMCVGQITRFGDSPEIFMMGIYVAPKLRV
jgi:hypothetical protein